MLKKSLIDYVRSLMQKGYSISIIREQLLKSGYSNKEIDEAIGSGYNPTIRHEISLSYSAIFVVVFIIVLLIGIASFFYYSPAKKTAALLDLNLEPVSTTVEAGENIVFLKELSNLGSSQRYDVVIKQEIIEQKTNRVVTQKIETRAIETFGSTQTRILIPKDTKQGDYVLRAIVEYGAQKAVATLPVKIVPFAKKETCFDGVKNQNEEGTDCGGLCRQCERQTTECDDNNPCTEDVMEEGACANNPIIPCCGNNVCEKNEEDKCAADCKKTAQPPFGLISTETLDEIKELAKVSPSKALQQCDKIEVPDLKDTCISNIGEAQNSKDYCSKIANARIKDFCYSNIAKSVNDNSLCGEISTEGRKDSCYMTFVLDNKDYSVCDRITNRQLRQSCESLKQLNELNEQQNMQQAPE